MASGGLPVAPHIASPCTKTIMLSYTGGVQRGTQRVIDKVPTASETSGLHVGQLTYICKMIEAEVEGREDLKSCKKANRTEIPRNSKVFYDCTRNTTSKRQVIFVYRYREKAL